MLQMSSRDVSTLDGFRQRLVAFPAQFWWLRESEMYSVHQLKLQIQRQTKISCLFKTEGMLADPATRITRVSISFTPSSNLLLWNDSHLFWEACSKMPHVWLISTNLPGDRSTGRRQLTAVTAVLFHPQWHQVRRPYAELSHGVASIRCIDSGKCTDRQAGQYVNFFPDNITSDKGVVSKLLRKSEEQYNAIFWEIWGLILPSIGDLRSIIDQYVKQGPPRPGISRNTPFANYCRSDTQN